MESSITPHLRTERRNPTRKHDDFQPPYPSFSARIPTSTTQVVMAYFGVHYPDPTAPPGAALDTLEEARAALWARPTARAR